MTLDDLNQYVNEDSIRGDLARELIGIISDYQSGTISHEEKSELVEQLKAAYLNSQLIEDEENVRLISNALSLVVSIV